MSHEGSLTSDQDEQKVLVGTSSGDIAVYSWDWFGDCKDRIVGHPEGVECMVKFDDGVILTGGEDGWIRSVGIYPHSMNVFQKHAEDLEECYSVAGISMSHDSRIVASISHDCSINFFDLTEFAEKVDEADLGEKIEMDQESSLHALKSEMKQKVKNKDKQEKRIMEKKSKLDFFGDM